MNAHYHFENSRLEANAIEFNEDDVKMSHVFLFISFLSLFRSCPGFVLYSIAELTPSIFGLEGQALLI